MRRTCPALVSLVVAALLTVSTAGVAQSPGAPASADPRGVQVDSTFARFDRRDAPGCAVAVIRAGVAAYTRGYGIADLENDVPITPTTAFYLASVSKQFAAYSVILLARDGTLSLDDDVRKFIPELYDFASRYGTGYVHNVEAQGDRRQGRTTPFGWGRAMRANASSAPTRPIVA